MNQRPRSRATLIMLALAWLVPSLAIAQKKEASAARSSFSFEPKETETVLAWAIQLVRAGRLEEATQRLKQVPHADPRLAREADRIQALASYRVELLESKVGKAVRLAEGAEISRVTAFADGQVELKDKVRSWAVPVTAIGPEALIAIQGRRAISGDHEWIAGYLRLLTGDSSFERYLSDEEEPDRALMADAGDYAKLAGIGRAAQILNDLGSESDPAVALDLLRSLTSQRDLPMVQSRLVSLREHAAGIVARSFDPSSLETLGLHAKIEKTDAGTPRLVYDFEDAKELEDFIEDKDYLEFDRGRLRGKARELPTRFELKNGALELQGASCIRQVLRFRAPMKVRYRVTYKSAPQDPNPVLIVGICADERESHVGFENVNRLYSLDRQNGVRKRRLFQEAKLLAEKSYSIELEHDGAQTAKVTVDTNWRQVQCGPTKQGHVILWFQTENGVRIDRLEIEGAVVLDERAKRLWVDSRLTELGFAASATKDE